MSNQKNVYGNQIQSCSLHPKTGFFRDGYCNCDPSDYGQHTVCAIMTDEFLEFSKSVGNDLSTPRPEYNFPGLSAGEQWCLCLERWIQAADQNCAPNVILEATNQSVLDRVSLETLQAHEF